MIEIKIYLTLTFGEGDNLQYCQHKMRRLWDDPARGKVPVNWSASPLLLDAAPAILSHYRRTATPNDLLVMGPSGVAAFADSLGPEFQIVRADHYFSLIRSAHPSPQ